MIYLDHASSSKPKPFFVQNAIVKQLKEISLNPLRNQNSSENLELYRNNLLKFLNLSENFSSIFTKNATEAANLFLFGIEEDFQTLLIDSYSHNAILRPAYKISKEKKNKLYILNRNTNFLSAWKNIIEKETKKTLLCVNMASNVTGEVLSHDELHFIFNLMKENKSLFLFLDASQYIGNFPFIKIPDFAAQRTALFSSSHKYLLGPESAGFLIFYKNMKINPLLFGGTGFDSMNKNMPESYPYKLEAGTYSMTTICGLNSSLEQGQDYFTNTYKKKLKYGIFFYNMLTNINNWHVYGPKPEDGKHCLVFSIVHDFLNCEELSFILWEQYKIITRSGFHCSPLVFENLPEKFKNGSLRISLGYNTKKQDIEKLLFALREIS
ncbi:MAG: aminotransferase class V-fold PLP-dependent enzyme [Spirochaetia bacterium]|nr:aminotransferase class V-fold PLP-dependent enzyme [Spirochaetia bacterium]